MMLMTTMTTKMMMRRTRIATKSMKVKAMTMKTMMTTMQARKMDKNTKYQID